MADIQSPALSPHTDSYVLQSFNASRTQSRFVRVPFRQLAELLAQKDSSELLLIAEPVLGLRNWGSDGCVMVPSAIVRARSTAENAMTVPIAPMPTNAIPSATTSLMANCLRLRMVVPHPLKGPWVRHMQG
jgi:hypothetical protein